MTARRSTAFLSSSSTFPTALPFPPTLPTSSGCRRRPPFLPVRFTPRVRPFRPSPCPRAAAPVVAALAPVLTPASLVVAGALVSFLLSAALGANDVANSLGTAVGTGAIRVSSALAIGAVMEFMGAVVFGSTVTKTISSGVLSIGSATLVAPTSYMLGMLAVLVGCTVWMAVATRFGLPVSSTHSVVGALVGLGLVSGWGIHYAALTRIVASWFLSPLCGGFVALVVYRTVSALIFAAPSPLRASRKTLPVLTGLASFVFSFSVLGKAVVGASHLQIVYLASAVSLTCALVSALLSTSRLQQQSLSPVTQSLASAPSNPLRSSSSSSLAASTATTQPSAPSERDHVERVFKMLQVATACLLAFSHGSNDVSNAIGPFAAMYSLWRHGAVAGLVADGAMVSIPVWVLVLGGLGISSGLGLFGRPVMETVGQRITKLRPSMGFCVELSTALTVLVASQLGLPVSTTQTLIGCIVALGLWERDLAGVDRSVVLSIAGSWGVTMPFSALFTVVFYVALRPFLPVVPALL